MKSTANLKNVLDEIERDERAIVEMKTRLAWNQLSTIRAQLDVMVVPGDEAHEAMAIFENNNEVVQLE